MKTSSAQAAKRHLRSKGSLLGLLTALTFLFILTPAVQAAEASWVRVNNTVQGQFLTKLQEKLVSDFGQAAGSYDYSVVEKLAVSGTMNAADYNNLKGAAVTGPHIEELDLSGMVDASAQALNGMTALTEVRLPPVGAFTIANPFQGDSKLRHVIVAAETYTFGSTTTFNGINTLERITFLHTTKPSMNASTFVGSNNADPLTRTVVASVPDETRGDYDKATFQDYFANVVESPTAGDLAELQVVIDEAEELAEGNAAAPYRWTLLQEALDSAEAVHDDAGATSFEVNQARSVLQTAMNLFGTSTLGLSFRVTPGAEVDLSWKNGTAQHFAEFTPFPVAKVDAFSDSNYDVFVPTVTMSYKTQNVFTAVKEGETDKVVKIFTTSAALANSQYTLDLQQLAGRVDTSLLIPGLGAGDNRGLYTNLGDTGVIDLDVGEHFDLDTIRTQQAQLDQINNLFIEPDYTFEVTGDSIATEEIGREGRRQLRITAEEPGVSVIKITYDPLHYLTATDNGTPGNTNWSFNGIDPQNTGLAVINVEGDAATFDTGIDVNNDLDTFYFDKNLGERDFTFTPAAGTTVRVHDPLNVSDWGEGWETYEASPDGSFTIKLKGGRNIVELTNGGEVRYRVVRAKGVTISVANNTDPGQPFEPGDVARVSVLGVEGGIDKLGGIYNPAFAAGTKPKLTYYDGAIELTSTEQTQYQTATTTFNVNYTFTGTGSDKALNGDMFIGGLGAEFPYHRILPLEGKPANLAAVAIGPYHFAGLPTLYVYDDQVSTVPGALEAPENLQLTHGDDSAGVSWAAPTSTGGLPVVGYSVRYSDDGGANWQTETFGTATGQTLGGLTNGTEYEVQVAAINTGGIGAYTASQTVTPRSVPGLPIDLVLTPRHNSLDLSWTAPADDGGSALTGYRVRYSSDSGANWTEQDFGTVTSQTITGLSNGTSYDVQVAAINGEGAGAFTASVAATPIKSGAALGTPSIENLTTTGADVVTDVEPGDLDQEISVEYSVNPDHSDSEVTDAVEVTAGSTEAPVTISLSGLEPNTTYFYRVVLTATDGEETSSAWSSFDTVANEPTLNLSANSTDLRVGGTVKLTWTTTDADTATASGDWSGDKSVSGSEEVVLDRAGRFTFTMEVSGEGGTTSATAEVWGTLAPAELGVNAPTRLIRVGTSVTVGASGLAAGESYRIAIGGIQVGAGVSADDGSLSQSVVVPNGLADGTVPVLVTGSLDDRAGSAELRVVAAKKLSVKVSKKKVRKGFKQRVTVSGLVAGEPVKLYFRGRQIAGNRATGKGTFSKTFRVGKGTGRKSVKAVGITDDRSGSRAFRVVR